MATLKQNPTIKDLQIYVKQITKERGWDKNSPIEIFFLMMEEIGELARAIRDFKGFYTEKENNAKKNLEEEFADVLAYLIDLANQFDIDLEKAFREKDEINKKREWTNPKMKF